MTRRGWLLFLALSVIWGIPYLLIKVAVRELTPASLVFLRTALGALLLLPAVMKNGNLRALLPRWRPILLFTLVEVALPWLLLSDAERRISSSLSGLLVASVPLLGALLSRLTGAHEPLGTRRLAGLGSLDVVAVSIWLCALAYAPVGIVQLPRAMPSPAVIGSVAVLGIACTAVAFLLFFRLIAEVGPVRATVITYLNPAIALSPGSRCSGSPSLRARRRVSC